MGSYKQALAGHNSNIEMSSFRDFKQNALWSGQSEKHTRSVSVFPHRNAGYYAYNLCSPQSLRRRAHSVERDCITPERDFLILERDFFAPERDFFTPERELFTPEREFFEKNLDPEEVWTKLKRKVFPLDPLPEPRVVRSRVVRAMEREMPHSRQAKVVLGHPRPVPGIYSQEEKLLPHLPTQDVNRTQFFTTKYFPLCWAVMYILPSMARL